MLRGIRRFVGVTAAALALAGALPAGTATAAAGPCRATSQSTGSEVAIVLSGSYVDKQGGDVQLTCYLVQGDRTVASTSDELSGPVAALASDQRLGTAPFQVCYEVTIWRFVDWGYYHYNSC